MVSFCVYVVNCFDNFCVFGVLLILWMSVFEVVFIIEFWNFVIVLSLMFFVGERLINILLSIFFYVLFSRYVVVFY